MTDASLSVVIPTWNTRDITLACIESLEPARRRRDLEVIVVDNGSRDGTAEAIEAAHPHVILVRNPRNLFFSRACNQGIERATREYVCILNSDTRVDDEALDKMLEFLANNPSYGAVGPRFLNLDGSLQAACRRFPRFVEIYYDHFGSPRSWAKRARDRAAMSEFDHLESADVDQPLGACILMRRKELTEMGGFDEDLPLFYSDVDLCKRLWDAGRRVRYLAEAIVVHHGSASVGRRRLWRAIFVRNQVGYFRKHYGAPGALFVRLVVLMRAFMVGARTRLGPRSRAEKRRLLRALRRETKISMNC